MVADLAKMPHLLVAGTTGSGKSVGVNAMILSLLYKSEPDHVRLIMVDPKMLELSIYEGIPHLLAPVVTDMKQAANALHWCVGEMERRYKLMSAMGVRNLAGYNSKINDAEKDGQHMPEPAVADAGSARAARRPCRYIVVIIDELADLMMVVGKKVEELIARLAQKARAVGHPPDPGHAAAERRRDHRPDQGQHPDAHRPSRCRARSTRAPSSTRWAPKRCSARATCSTSRPAPASRCACMAPSSPTTKCIASSST